MSDPSIQAGPQANGRLDSWKEIAAYLNRGARTVQRWERQEGLPVHRLLHQKQGSVYAYKAELDAWWSARGANLEDKDGQAAVSPPHRRRLWVWPASVALLAVVLVGIWRFSGTGGAGGPMLRLVPLTSYPGLENYPSLSPDGKQVAFTWDGGGSDSPNTYVKLIGAERPLRLTTNQATDFQPVWAPDGNSIAFLRVSEGPTAELFITSSLGGTERKVTGLSDPRTELPDPFLTWSPDGKWLIAVDKPSIGEPYGLTLVSAESGEKRRLTSPPSKSLGDTAPAVSPDGRTVAFVRCEFEVCDLFLQDFPAGRAPRRLTSQKAVISSPMWIGGGQEILYLRTDGETPTLWRVSVSGSRDPRVVNSIGSPGYRWTASRQGDRLAYVSGSADLDLYALELSNAAGRSNEARRVASSTRIEMEPDISPDGRRIAFMSSRSGSPEIWIADADGSNPVQLTSFGGQMTSAPKWSPDGKLLAFESAPKGNTDVFVIGAEGGRPRAVVAEPSNDCGPGWSRDGKWLYFASDRSGRFEIWKMPAAGGSARQITRNGGYAAAESFTGEYLFFTKTHGLGEPGLWRIPLGGGDETRIIESLYGTRNFAVTEEGIYFFRPRTAQRGYPLSLYTLATGEVGDRAFVAQSVRTGLSVGPAASPGGGKSRWAVFSAFEKATGDLMLVENFR